MTNEHSIDELKRQYQAARDRAKQAGEDVESAKERLKEAILAQSGMLGHIVEGPEQAGWKNERRIVVEEVYQTRFGNGNMDKFSGHLLKKDGTKSLRTAEVVIATARDLGPYSAKAAE